MTLRPYRHIHPRIAPSAWIDPSAQVIGDVEIGEDSSIWPLCVVRGDVQAIRIGARCNIQDGSVLHVTHAHGARPQGHATLIGDDVTVGHKVILHGCTVHGPSLIGMGSLIMDGAILQPGVLLAAGSLVPEGAELEGGYLWLGRPAKRLRALTGEESGRLAYTARHYVRLKNDYLAPGQTPA